MCRWNRARPNAGLVNCRQSMGGTAFANRNKNSARLELPLWSIHPHAGSTEAHRRKKYGSFSRKQSEGDGFSRRVRRRYVSGKRGAAGSAGEPRTDTALLRICDPELVRSLFALPLHAAGAGVLLRGYMDRENEVSRFCCRNTSSE
jgi:hypothetical protein